MKNIHVIPTDKPSRLYLEYGDGVLSLAKQYLPQTSRSNNQHIYITSSEKIKEGDWFYNIICLKPEPFKACENGDGYVNCSKYSHNRIDCKKIILTTDPELIKDGVQSIDDEFLEWFVKNPSCEFIEVKDIKTIPALQLTGNNHLMYEIIIPKEEPKQENCCTPVGQIKRYKDCIGCDRKPKQKTLEEAAEKLFPIFNRSTPFGSKYPWTPHKEREAFKRGAKWQAERMYSEEDLKAAYLVGKHGGVTETHYDFEEWFKQFKKK